MNSAQKGLVSENDVTAAIIAQSGGRLKVARSRPDDHGVDRLVFRTDALGSMSLQIKASFTPGKQGARRFGFRLNEIPPAHRSYYGLCVAYVRRPARMANDCWLIPAAVLLEGRDPSIKRIVHIPKSPSRKSKWEQYRLPTRRLAAELTATLDALAPAEAY